MQRSFFWRMIVGVAVAVASWVAMESSAAAHCLGGEGIYNCCRQAAYRHASTGRAVKYGYEYGRPYRYGYGKAYGRSEIHRTSKLSARNRNGGIN
jgi:hypothetical protein